MVAGGRRVATAAPPTSPSASLRPRLAPLLRRWQPRPAPAQMAEFQAAAEAMECYLREYEAIADRHIAALDPSFQMRKVRMGEGRMGGVEGGGVNWGGLWRGEM